MAHVFSIGHSTLGYEAFVERLKTEGVTAIADVRTSPFSRNFPQFNKDTLRSALAHDLISYVFLGEELGGRPRGKAYYSNGIADYEKMASAESFNSGLDRIEQGASKHRIAMMCSEHNPLDCHRCLLVGRALIGRGIDVSHILLNEGTATQKEVEKQLLELAGKQEEDMFASMADRLNEAYRQRARKVAFAAIEPAGSLGKS